MEYVYLCFRNNVAYPVFTHMLFGFDPSNPQQLKRAIFAWMIWSIGRVVLLPCMAAFLLQCRQRQNPNCWSAPYSLIVDVSLERRRTRYRVGGGYHRQIICKFSAHHHVICVRRMWVHIITWCASSHYYQSFKPLLPKFTKLSSKLNEPQDLWGLIS